MLRSGLTYSKIIEALTRRGIATSTTGVRNVIAGITRRQDIREVIAELVGESVDQLWPEPTDHAA